LRQEVEVDPQVAPRVAAYDKAYERYRALRVSPDTTDLAMAEADDDRRQTGAAQWDARQAGLARATDRLKAEGFVLIDPESHELFAKGEVRVDPPTPVAVHGFVFTPYTDAPWQVELQWADMDNAKPPLAPVDLHACGGALIAPAWVLTAAHCVWDRAAGKPYGVRSLRVRAGSQSLADPMPRGSIDRIVLPQGAQRYVPSTAFTPAQNDIALLHISTPLKASPGIALVNLAPANLAALPNSPSLVVSGWGATEAETFGEQTQRAVQGGRLRMNPVLRFAPLDLIDNASCFRRIEAGIKAIYPTAQVGALTPSSLCAGSPQTGTCVGDSGGPLVLHDAPMTDQDEDRLRVGQAIPVDRPMLVGIVSWGVGCEDFTVFTRVSSYAGWIAATISPPARRRPPAPRRPRPVQRR
jgi:secreted trypsin-like serine protease